MWLERFDYRYGHDDTFWPVGFDGLCRNVETYDEKNCLYWPLNEVDPDRGTTGAVS
jgi:hypothetical protein